MRYERETIISVGKRDRIDEDRTRLWAELDGYDKAMIKYETMAKDLERRLNAKSKSGEVMEGLRGIVDTPK